MYRNGNGAIFVSDGSTLLRSKATASDDSPARQRSNCTVLLGSGSQSPWCRSWASTNCCRGRSVLSLMSRVTACVSATCRRAAT